MKKKYQRKGNCFVFATAALLLLLTGCGGGDGGGSKRDNPPPTPVVSISILPTTASTTVGVSRSFSVTSQNTDFSLSAPAAAGCVRNGNTITCTPTAEGTHTITVTATANGTTRTAQLTVLAPEPESEIELIEDPDVIDEIVSADGTVQKTVTFKSAGYWTASIADIRAMNDIAYLGAENVATLAGIEDDCELSRNSGSAGTYTITITCKPGNISDDRIIEITISTENEALVITITQKPVPRSDNFTTISYPGAADTALYGINNNGVVIGEFFERVGNVTTAKAFVKNGGSFDLADPPGAVGNVYVFGINDSGQVLGFNDNRYFLKTGTGYQYLDDYTGAYITDYTGINNSGQLSGYITDIDGYSRGFIKTGGSFTLIDHPAAAAACAYYRRCGTYITGINNLGLAAGVYVDPDGFYRGFVKDGGNYIPVEHPDSMAAMINTYIEGINDYGQLAGYFWDADGYARGFVKDGGRFVEVIHPDAAEYGEGTYFFGINNSGRIAGWFDDGDNARGFLLEIGVQ